MLSKKLIRRTNKIFRSASNTFKTADFVYISEQEILPRKKRDPKKCGNSSFIVILDINTMQLIVFFLDFSLGDPEIPD